MAFEHQVTARVDDEDAGEAFLESAKILLATAHHAPKRSRLKATDTLWLLAWILHSALVVLHFILLVIWAKQLEHHFTIALENQKFVSFLITATTTAFGTVYSALLVFVTQTLSTRRSLQLHRLLTTTHDNVAAWAGIGAAISLLWNQRVGTRGSSSAVFPVFLYLATVLGGLHITSSSLFSLVTFTSERSLMVGTHGIPVFNMHPDVNRSGANFGWPGWVPNDTVGETEAFADMFRYAPGSLYSLLTILGSETSLGLHEATLYDVLDTVGNVPGSATVNATGFNVTCGSLPQMQLNFSEEGQSWMVPNGGGEIFSTQPGMISTTRFNGLSGVIFYSTIPILDSNGQEGSWATLNPPMNTSISTIQLFRCTLSLVSQAAVLDSQTQRILTLEPQFKNNASIWMPYKGDYGAVVSDVEENPFIGYWQAWFGTIPASTFFLDNNFFGTGSTASLADIYLIQKLNLPAANGSHTLNVTLDAVENAISTIVAAMFWTLGHIPPAYPGPNSLNTFDTETGMSTRPLSYLPVPPILIQGKANVTETVVEVRLELSILAISFGLVVSIVLMMLCFPLLRLPRGLKYDKDLSIDGTGILHAIWLYRNHPELETLLEQVEYPTDENLREAGMVCTRLIGTQHNRDKSYASS